MIYYQAIPVHIKSSLHLEGLVLQLGNGSQSQVVAPALDELESVLTAAQESYRSSWQKAVV